MAAVAVGRFGAALSLLQEPCAALQVHALTKLNELLEVHWAEASELVTQMEALAEDTAFPARELAAAVASKCYYHLEDYTQALRLALAAGPHFDIHARSEYTECLIARCIDQYTAARVKAMADCPISSGEAGAEAAAAAASAAEPAVEAVVNRMFQRCWEVGSYRAALGVALEARRLDAVEETLRRAIAAGVRVRPEDATASTSALAASAAAPTDDVVMSAGAVTTVPSLAASAAAVAATPSAGVDFLSFALEVVLACVPTRAWRRTVMRTLARLHSEARDTLGCVVRQASASAASSSAEERDWLSLCKVLQSLDDADALSSALVTLLRRGCGVDAAPDGTLAPARAWSNSEPVLTALQVAFDLFDAEDQGLLVRVYQALPPPVSVPAMDVSPPTAAVAAAEDMVDTDSAAGGGAGAGAGASAPPVAAKVAAGANPVTDVPLVAFGFALKLLKSVLDGSVPTALGLDFLSSANSTDLVMLKQVKGWVDPRSTILHSAVVTSHALMQAGTTADGFLRSNLDWLLKASNWAKFSVVASSGVVHRGNFSQAMDVLSSYLPATPGAPTSSPYSEGGALYALGLIHANNGTTAAAGIRATPSSIAVEGAGAAAGAAAADDEDEDEGAAEEAEGGIVGYLLNALKGTQDETVLHGASLGLGLAAMGTGSEVAFVQLRDIVHQNNAISGEGAALALGLLLLGKGTSWHSDAVTEPVVEELLSSARENQKERIIRGLALGLAFMVYGLEESADALIEEMGRDKDAVLRYGAQYATGLAYVGTGNNAALRRLLHVAVSDVADDVRRAAVTNIGFLLIRSPLEVITVVSHLAESYNAHVRYGAAMAVGVACAGSGLPEAVGLLEPLLDDGSDFVRQGALLAMGLVLQQESAAHLPRVGAMRERLSKIISGKHEGTLSKMGAILSLGLMDAGGRNATVSVLSRNGFLRPAAVTGLVLFLQYWYWFPLLHGISLSMHPSALLGITGELQLPSGEGAFAPHCAAPPSWFAYPPPTEEKKEDKRDKLAVVELSTASRSKAKAAAAAAAKGSTTAAASTAAPAAAATTSTTMEVEAVSAAPVGGASAAAPLDAATIAAPVAGTATAAEGGAATAAATAAAPAAPKEASFSRLSNPSRVTPSQAKFVTLAQGPLNPAQRFVAIRGDVSALHGVLGGNASATPSVGVVMLRDLDHGAPLPAGAVLRAVQRPSKGAGAPDEGPEPKAPKAFEWVVGSYYVPPAPPAPPSGGASDPPPPDAPL